MTLIENRHSTSKIRVISVGLVKTGWRAVRRPLPDRPDTSHKNEEKSVFALSDLALGHQ